MLLRITVVLGSLLQLEFTSTELHSGTTELDKKSINVASDLKQLLRGSAGAPPEKQAPPSDFDGDADDEATETYAILEDKNLEKKLTEMVEKRGYRMVRMPVYGLRKGSIGKRLVNPWEP